MNPYFSAVVYRGGPAGGGGNNSPLYYPRTRSFDLRAELHALLFGDYEQPGIGRPVIVRRLTDRRCVCWRADISSADAECRYCAGEGYLWTETAETAYLARNFGSVLSPSTVISQQDKLNMAGYGDENKALAFFEYTVFPNYERYTIPTEPAADLLYELKVDPEGRAVRPFVRSAKWQIRSVTPHHGDNGRVEMFEVGCDSVSVS